MIDIKKVTQNILDKFKTLFECFPITTIVIFLATIVYAISIDNNFFSSDVLAKIMQFSAMFSVGSYFIETCIKHFNKKKIVFELLVFIISVIFTTLLNIKNDLFNIENAIINEYTFRVTIAYAISLFLLSVYISLKNSKMKFEEYVVRVCSNIFKSSIIFGLLSIGLTIISSVFVFLILNGEHYDLVLKVEILLLGIYYIPRLLFSLYNIKVEISTFFRFIVKYVLSVLVIIAFGIIYMYIAKILITQDIPSNQIFRIIASLFIIGLPIWTMASYFKDNKVLYKINSKLPYLFIPFIFLQIYSIGVRIAQNGITEARYLCVMLILFEIVYIALYFKRREKIANIIIVFVCFSIISLIVPVINMYSVSLNSQFNNLRIYRQKDNLTDKDKDKISGAYYYLKNAVGGEALIDNYLSYDEIQDITDFKTEYYDSYSQTITVSEDIEEINIEGYKKLYEVSSNYYLESKNIDEVFKNIEFSTQSDEYRFNIDISNIIKSYIENKDNINEYFKNNNRFIIDENRCIVITSFYINYGEDDLINSYYIGAYILEK